jgi:hypothetical protein
MALSSRESCGPAPAVSQFGAIESGLASGEVRGTPTIFIDGVVHLGAYEAATLIDALGR